MPNRVNRRERRIRLYYLRAVLERMAVAAGGPVDYAAVFDVDFATFNGWLRGDIPVPAWIPPLAIQAYRIPPPPPSRVPVLVRWILLVVAAGVAAVLLMAQSC